MFDNLPVAIHTRIRVELPPARATLVSRERHQLGAAETTGAGSLGSGHYHKWPTSKDAALTDLARCGVDTIRSYLALPL